NDGDGSRRASLFLDNPDLANPSTSYPETREIFFTRVRAPVVKAHPEQLPTAQHPTPDRDSENLALRTFQAYMHWIPRLGGNGNDMPETIGDKNDAERRASLTQLQYDRLKKWSEGKFVTSEKFTKLRRYTSCRAASSVDICGIGVVYGSSPLPRHRVLLGRRVWRNVRPDEVLTKEYLHPDRRRWDDGLDRRPQNDPEKEDDDRYGNLEMDRKWFKLGFVSSINYEPQSEYHLERELPLGSLS
ncbi:hypothetical protein FRC04_010052, partial [Tulasnella sp. 424]